MRDLAYHPAHAYLETGARRLGRIRRKTADRMASMRERWREAGRPDPATLDRAIVDAVRDLLLAAPEGKRLVSHLDPEAILLQTARHLVERSERSAARGREVTVYRREAVSEALQNRLLSRPKTAS